MHYGGSRLVRCDDLDLRVHTFLHTAEINLTFSLNLKHLLRLAISAGHALSRKLIENTNWSAPEAGSPQAQASLPKPHVALALKALTAFMAP